ARTAIQTYEKINYENKYTGSKEQLNKLFKSMDDFCAQKGKSFLVEFKNSGLDQEGFCKDLSKKKEKINKVLANGSTSPDVEGMREYNKRLKILQKLKKDKKPATDSEVISELNELAAVCSQYFIGKFTDKPETLKVQEWCKKNEIPGTGGLSIPKLQEWYTNEVKEADSNAESSKNTGSVYNGTDSKFFTPSVKAFLDAIAKHETESNFLTAESYDSGNFKPNDFNASNSSDLNPKLKSGGTTQKYNIGRYQYLATDVPDANKGLALIDADFVIKDFKPLSQDYFPLGKFAIRAKWLNQNEKNLGNYLNGSESDLKKAIGIASGEWASMPVVEGFKHADTKQAKWNYSEFVSFYEQRKAEYSKSQ
ncbi:MAG: hypothetical protein ACRCXZ_07470, partial [Patescibacteria group bacterium]